MEIVKLDDKPYKVKNTLSDLTLGEWLKFVDAINEVEMIEIGETAGGEMLTEVATVNSPEFLKRKRVKILTSISNIPEDLLMMEELASIIESLLTDSLLNIEKSNTISFRGSTWTYKQMYDWTFQQFCDFDTLSDNNRVRALKLVITKDTGAPYDRYANDLDSKGFIDDMPANITAPLYVSLLEDLKTLRSYYKFLFEFPSSGAPAGGNLKIHYQMFKWEDTIVTLAQSTVFNSPQGTLHGVRNARATEVLEYLNLMRSKDSAEYLDQQASESARRHSKAGKR
jgi:hypothetical protein